MTQTLETKIDTKDEAQRIMKILYPSLLGTCDVHITKVIPSKVNNYEITRILDAIAVEDKRQQKIHIDRLDWRSNHEYFNYDAKTQILKNIDEKFVIRNPNKLQNAHIIIQSSNGNIKYTEKSDQKTDNSFKYIHIWKDDLDEITLDTPSSKQTFFFRPSNFKFKSRLQPNLMVKDTYFLGFSCIDELTGSNVEIQAYCKNPEIYIINQVPKANLIRVEFNSPK